jgi:hypothetical protein
LLSRRGSRSDGCTAPADDAPALDPGGDIDGVAGLAQRRFLLQPLVRAVAVILSDVLGQHLPLVPLAEDQHVIQALTAQRSHEALRERVRPRRPDRRPDHPRAVTGEDVVECNGELTVPVADEEPEPPGPLAEVSEQVPGLLGGPGSGRMGGDAQDAHRPRLELHHEQHVHAPQQHGVDM